MKNFLLSSVPPSFEFGCEIVVTRQTYHYLVECVCLGWWEVRKLYPSDTVVQYAFFKDEKMHIHIVESKVVRKSPSLYRRWNHLRIKESILSDWSLDESLLFNDRKVLDNDLRN